MRISWLSADEIAAARQALTAGGQTWGDHFASGEFASPAAPAETTWVDLHASEWRRITEHVARAERVSQVVRDYGLDEARTRFAGSTFAIEVATLAAAAHEGSLLDLEQVLRVLRCPIDSHVFYAPFLELMIELGRGEPDRVVRAYEEFVGAYSSAIVDVPRASERVGAVRDGLADYYVAAGRLEDAEALFVQRHDEDRGDVAVALSASRAFLAAGSVSHAVRWLGKGVERALTLGRSELATKLLQKLERVRERLS